MNRLSRLWNGTRLFIRSLQEKPAGNIAPQAGMTARGNAYELYQPKGGAWKTIVPVYGMGLPGERDPRLNKFVQACLETNLRVVVPDLPGMKAYRLETGDLDRLIDVLQFIRTQHREEITIVAFSAGASISLSACAAPSLADQIKSALLFSPLYDIREVWQTLHRQEIDRSSHKNWDNALWTQYVIAYRNRDRLGLSDDEKAIITNTLRYYDIAITDREKREFYERVIAPMRLQDKRDLLMEEDAFEILSPRGKLDRVRARIAILHDATDTVVPPSHSERILAELRERENGQQRLLITNLLAHVTVQGGANLVAVFKLIDMLGEVFV